MRESTVMAMEQDDIRVTTNFQTRLINVVEQARQETLTLESV